MHPESAEPAAKLGARELPTGGTRPEAERLAGSHLFHSEDPPTAFDIRDALVIKEGDLFLLTNLEGDVPPGDPNGFGLYYQDTRFLSGYDLVIQGLRPIILLSTARSHFIANQVLSNPNLVTASGRTVHEQTIQIRRYRLLRPSAVSESLTFENFNLFPLTLEVAFHLDVDFADIFEVRGFVHSTERGELDPPEYQDGRLTFTYHGRDGIRRVTAVRFDPPPREVDGQTVHYELELPARGSQRVGITVEVASAHDEDRREAQPMGPQRAPGLTLAGYRHWLPEQTSVETSSELFNGILRQAADDVRVLVSGEDDASYPAAGIPWYATLFGRDSLITALQELWRSTFLARQTLRLLAQLQGQRDDPWKDEEPGKILHELRRGELANLGVVPFAPYYGTIDATLLWVLLLGEYYRASGDVDLVRELRPHLEAALGWIERYGDLDGDGFVEYRRRSGSGLVNQGWKDSWDGVVHADGSLPEPPIALVEVQGYLYAARRAAARLYRALGDNQRAERLDQEARRVREAFNEDFWMPDEGFYCLALDGHKRQVAVVSSNPGHALWSGIVAHDRERQVARRLMDKDLFSGWGIRTLSSREVRYNPVGYHVGSVWPHDNALIAFGLKRSGQTDLVVELITGLYEAAQQFPSFRMPELFCGFARSAFGTPVRYPVACSPQAWAASAWSALLQVMLGIRIDASSGEVRIVHPSLPPWLQWVNVRGLAVGGGAVDLRYERVGDHTAVDVAALRGGTQVTFAEQWELDEA